MEPQDLPVDYRPMFTLLRQHQPRLVPLERHRQPQDLHHQRRRQRAIPGASPLMEMVEMLDRRPHLGPTTLDQDSQMDQEEEEMEAMEAIIHLQAMVKFQLVSQQVPRCGPRTSISRHGSPAFG